MTIESVLQLLGFSDQALETMGPTLAILLSWAAGGAVAQGVKFPLSRTIPAAWFDWTIRTLAIVATFAFSLLLSDMPVGLAAVAAVAQPVWYHFSLAMIRRWWPWLEVSPIVGSVSPPPSAFTAAAQRKANQNEEDGSA